MKKFAFLSMFFLLLFGCSKEESAEYFANGQIEVQARGESCDTCLCIAPNGCTLPCSELNDWETYTADYDPDNPELAGKWKYLTYSCVTADGKPGLECHKAKNGDCREAFSCTVCGNCY